MVFTVLQEGRAKLFYHLWITLSESIHRCQKLGNASKADSRSNLCYQTRTVPLTTNEKTIFFISVESSSDNPYPRPRRPHGVISTGPRTHTYVKTFPISFQKTLHKLKSVFSDHTCASSPSFDWRQPTLWWEFIQYREQRALMTADRQRGVAVSQQ